MQALQLGYLVQGVAAAALLAGRRLADALEAGQRADDPGEAVKRDARLRELLNSLGDGPAIVSPQCTH